MERRPAPRNRNAAARAAVSYAGQLPACGGNNRGSFSTPPYDAPNRVLSMKSAAMDGRG